MNVPNNITNDIVIVPIMIHNANNLSNGFITLPPRKLNLKTYPTMIECIYDIVYC